MKIAAGALVILILLTIISCGFGAYLKLSPQDMNFSLERLNEMLKNCTNVENMVQNGRFSHEDAIGSVENSPKKGKLEQICM